MWSIEPTVYDPGVFGGNADKLGRTCYRLRSTDEDGGTRIVADALFPEDAQHILAALQSYDRNQEERLTEARQLYRLNHPG